MPTTKKKKYNKVKDIQELLDLLTAFPKIKTIGQLRKELKERLKAVAKPRLTQKHRIQAKHRSTSYKTKIAEANATRSSKLRKHHNYIRLVHDSHPEIPYIEIRRQYKARKQGQEVSIPDVAWQNVSP